MKDIDMEDLMVFLTCPSPKFTKAGVDIVLELSGSEDGVDSLATYAKMVLRTLSRLLTAKKELSEPAAEALVNLSHNSDVAAKMVAMGIIGEAMDVLRRPVSGITRMLVVLLVNLTKLDAGIASLLQTREEKMRGLHVMKLVRLFCRSPCENGDDPLEHVGSILVTISEQDAGRKLLLAPKRGLLQEIARTFNSSSPLKKKGVVGIICNCCFDVEGELQSLLLISEFLWPALLLPVAGSRIYDEQDTSRMPLELGIALSIEREPVIDPEIRVQALEAIHLISLQEAGRRSFWSVNGPRILQVGYGEEEHPQVMEAYERVGSLIHKSGKGERSTET